MPVCIESTAAQLSVRPAAIASTARCSFQRGAHRALRVVAPRHGHAEDGHHLVADELVDAPAVSLDHGDGFALDARHDHLDLFGVEGFVQRGVTSEIREHDGRVTPFA